LKRICFVTTISDTLRAFVLSTAKYLHENGEYDITFICDDDEEFSKTLPDYIRFIPVSMKRGLSVSGIGAIFKMISIFKYEKFDLIQYSTPNASFYTSIAAKFVGIPVRLYCQWGLLYTSFSGFKRLIFKSIEKLICSFSTWIQPDSYGNLSFCREEGLYTDKKSSVIWNGSASGVNLKKFDISNKEKWRNEIRSKYEIAKDTFVLGFVGRITKDKGINELFTGIKKFFDEQPNSRLILIGNLDKPKTMNQQLIDWSLKEKRIIYCGRTNEVEKYLSAMDAFVLPSYREGFGSVVIEAEAMGIPVIVTNIPGPTDAILPNETGIIVKKGDVENLYQAIKTLSLNKTLCLKMGINGEKFAKEKFDQAVLLEYILNNRNSLLKQKSR